jgi:hypothetical protein
MPTISIWTVADFGAADVIDLLNGTFTVQPGGFDSASFSDDEAAFEDFFGGGGQIQDPGLNQTLTSDLVLDGVTVGVVGDEIYNAAEGDIVNNTTGETGRIIYITLNGGSVAEFIGVATTIVINPGDSVTTSNLDPVAAEPFENIVCFTPGTLIETPCGPRLIEDLEEGDFVLTDDSGAQPIRKIVSRTISSDMLALKPHLAPVCIRTHALAMNVPYRNLTVSPQHRMVLKGWRAQLMFGTTEVMAAAVTMVDECTILRQPPDRPVTYIHLIFDRHEIITANGALTESLYPGKTAQRAFSSSGLAELFEVFPELETGGELAPARPVLKAFEARALIPRGPHQ